LINIRLLYHIGKESKRIFRKYRQNARFLIRGGTVKKDVRAAGVIRTEIRKTDIFPHDKLNFALKSPENPVKKDNLSKRREKRFVIY